MKKHIRAAALLTAIIFAVCMAGCKTSDRPLTDDDKSRIQTRFREYIDDRGFSGSVYAVYRGEVVFDGGAGKATKTLDNGSDVAYGVASLTKQFTAAAVTQLYEDGLLDVNDKLSKYFPDYRYGDSICIKHLLSQRSGIPYYSVSSLSGVVVISCDGCKRHISVDVGDSAEVNREKIRDFFLSTDLLFEPGTEFDYSDSNFSLLAEIVAQVSGMSYHDYVRENIFEPLGMESSGFIDDYDEESITSVAQTDRSEFSMDYYTVGGTEYGCGDVLTTPKDLYRWYLGLTGGKVVGEGAYRLMTTNFSNSDELGYGYGLMVSDEGDSKAVFHYGYIPSYYSAIIFFPEYDYCQVVLSNHADCDPHKLAEDLAVYFGSVIDLEVGDL